MELYGWTEWRTSERDDVKRCIQRILVRKLEGNYQNNSSEEIRGELVGRVGEIWREGQGVTERNLESEDNKKEEGKEERNQ